MDERNYLSVSDVNTYLKQQLSRDPNLKRIYLKGEISNFTDHARLGHLYFTLKDEKCAIKAVLFKWNKSRLTFTPENGMNVVVAGSIQVYERDGIFQIVAENMIPYGEGALNIAFEQLKQKLSKEGLFDTAHKKKIPAIPKRIGVITAGKGAALQDIINILSRRYPLVTLVVIDSLVQGEAAPESLCAALEACKGQNLDTIIIGRGGGSLEDLWAFNNETLARAVYACEIPIISAVGHETDFTICDFVADLRAPTPSAAAELATPNIQELRAFVDNRKNMLQTALSAKLERYRLFVRSLTAAIAANGPAKKAALHAETLTRLDGRLRTLFDQTMFERRKRFSTLLSKLEVLSPLHTLARGFSLTMDTERRTLHSVGQLSVGDTVRTRLFDGAFLGRVEAIEQDEKR